MIKGGTVRDGGAKVHLRDGTGPLTNIKHINPRITVPARTSICYGRNGVSPFPSLSIGQRIYLLDPHIPFSLIKKIELGELKQGLNVSSLSRISHA